MCLETIIWIAFTGNLMLAMIIIYQNTKFCAVCLLRMGLCGQRPVSVPKMTPCVPTKGPTIGNEHHNWTMEQWNMVACTDESHFILNQGVHFPKASLEKYGCYFHWTLLVMTELVLSLGNEVQVDTCMLFTWGIDGNCMHYRKNVSRGNDPSILPSFHSLFLYFNRGACSYIICSCMHIY